tara:strand:+ start:918 stop:1508 length:591 start_codon:yes stop_codon:yes gene_type:complete
MTIDQLLDYMYENHRIRRQKDIAKFFNVSTQAISNWKRSGRVPAKYALKIQVSKPTDYKELVETLTDVLISLNKNIKEIKSIQAISNISAQYFSNGVFSDRNGIPIVKLIDIEGDWENLTGYKKEEILEMDNIIGKIMEIENVQEYLSRLHPIGLSEASYKGYWIFKHKNGNKFKISGKTWIDYNENTFKSAFSVA